MKNANLISVSVLIDKYVTVHLNKNEPQQKKETYIFRGTTRQHREDEKKLKRETPHLVIPNGHMYWTHKHKHIPKKQQIKKRYAHNTQIVIGNDDRCWLILDSF